MSSRSLPRRRSPTPGAPQRRLGFVAGIPLLVAAVAIGASGVSATVAGCYWIRYHDLLLTHVALMSGMASDAADQLSLEARPLAPSDIERLRYPLQRAQHFLNVSRGRRSDLGSFRAFEGFVDAYGGLVDYLDRVRVGVIGPGPIAEAERRAADLEARAEEIRAEVGRETG
ncbi:MAG: hypothetical protein V3R77_09275 [Candidatus Binatia bacterium]